MEICRNYRHILFDLLIQYSKIRVRVMVFNAAFNNISVISWLSVVLVEETGVRGKNHRPIASR
jgi:hypothetical protein